jgi:hypothetical protein
MKRIWREKENKILQTADTKNEFAQEQVFFSLQINTFNAAILECILQQQKFLFLTRSQFAFKDLRQ